MKNHKTLIMKSVQIVKILFLNFVQKICKTFTRTAKTKFMMVLPITIILVNQRTNKSTINMSSHNLKLSCHWELILLSECEIVLYFCL